MTTASTPTTLQGVIERLTGFWHAQGCAVLPPCSFEVPLGLLHPEAFFRLLDPGPWRAAFVQPISRPSDARGGEHPYRTARHLQLQVVWKDVEPRQPRDLVIKSLRHVGFELEQHDLRFVDQRLHVEAGEVRGRGWRVMLDGLRLGRMTFLESVAGTALGRPTVELSYGVELVAMARTQAADIFAVPWLAAAELAGASDGARAKRREGEKELHAYAVHVADVEYLRRSVDDLDAEALRCLDAGLPRIAYEHAMRMLPLLDVLESRGALSFRERSQRLGAVRARVTESARGYLESIRGVAPHRRSDRGAAGPPTDSGAPAEKLQSPPVELDASGVLDKPSGPREPAGDAGGELGGDPEGAEPAASGESRDSQGSDPEAAVPAKKARRKRSSRPRGTSASKGKS